MPEYGVLNIVEAADLLRISPGTAKKMAREGRLPGTLPRLGRAWRVSERVLREYIDRPTVDANGKSTTRRKQAKR